jgi:glutamate-1-semialdehyde 2,1-aminomutase
MTRTIKTKRLGQRQKNQDVLAESSRYLAGRVIVTSREPVPWPPFLLAWAKGAQLGDIEHKSYIDYTLADGDLILGHAPTNVVLAVKRSAERGISFGFLSRAKVDLARWFCRNIPSCQEIEFSVDRPTALSLAKQLAQNVTGKKRILALSWQLLVPTLGVSKEEERMSFVSDPGNFEKIYAQVTNNAEEIAAVIIEPVGWANGIRVLPAAAFATLRQITAKQNILLILDETVTGFRGRVTGYQGEAGVAPDLTVWSGILGAGFAFAALGGRRDVLSGLGRLPGSVFFDNPVALRAGWATVRFLNENFYRALDRKVDDFVADLNRFWDEQGSPVRLTNYHSLVSLSWSGAAREDAAQLLKNYQTLWHFLFRQGILWPAHFLQPFCICASHRQKDLQVLAAALKEFFINISKIQGE